MNRNSHLHKVFTDLLLQVKKDPKPVRIAGIILLLLILYFILKPTLLQHGNGQNLLDTFIKNYRDSLLYLGGIIFDAAGIRVRFFPGFDYLAWPGGSSGFGSAFLSLRQSFIFILLVFFFHKDYRHTILWITGGLAVIYLVNFFRLVSMVMVPVDTGITRNFYRAVLSISIFLYFLLKIKSDPRYSPYFNRINSYLKERTILQFGPLILLFLSKDFLIQLYQWIFPRELLARLVLHETAWIIRLFGADPRIEGRFIFIRRTWVYLGDACLGIMLILTYLSLLFVLKARLINKVLWMVGGILVITVINSVRIAAISFHLQNHGGTFNPKIDPHDLFSYMVYGAVFVMWVIFIRWGRSGGGRYDN